MYMKILCSACLLGVACRYNATIKPCDRVTQLLSIHELIPVCPEQLGGLSTPRKPAEIKNGRVITCDGEDITEQFIHGAKEVLKIAKLYGAQKAILKQRSPSCGCGQLYDGTFSGNLVEGDGVTTQLLKKNGVTVISEEDV